MTTWSTPWAFHHLAAANISVLPVLPGLSKASIAAMLRSQRYGAGHTQTSYIHDSVKFIGRIQYALFSLLDQCFTFGFCKQLGVCILRRSDTLPIPFPD